MLRTTCRSSRLSRAGLVQANGRVPCPVSFGKVAGRAAGMPPPVRDGRPGRKARPAADFGLVPDPVVTRSAGAEQLLLLISLSSIGRVQRSKGADLRRFTFGTRSSAG